MLANDKGNGHLVEVGIKIDPETNEVIGPYTRGLSSREVALRSILEETDKGIARIFREGKLNDAMLHGIETDIRRLLEKVNGYAGQA